MKCPICIDVELDVKHSHGIEIDVCQRCGGVWLNRGELEKLAAKAVAPLKPYEPLDDADVVDDQVASPINDARRDGQPDDRREWKSDRRGADRDDDDDDDHDDDHDDDDDDDDREKKRWKKSGFGDMLEDIFDDVLDLDDLFDWD